MQCEQCQGENMSLKNYVINNFYWIMAADILFFTVLIGIYNVKMVLPFAFFGLVKLIIIDRYQEKLMRNYDYQNE
jgi:hypothetical protein